MVFNHCVFRSGWDPPLTLWSRGAPSGVKAAPAPDGGGGGGAAADAGPGEGGAEQAASVLCQKLPSSMGSSCGLYRVSPLDRVLNSPPLPILQIYRSPRQVVDVALACVVFPAASFLPPV